MAATPFAIRVVFIALCSRRRRFHNRDNLAHNRHRRRSPTRVKVRSPPLFAYFLAQPQLPGFKIANHSISNGRSIAFFYRFCTDLVAELTIPPLASYLMSRNIWIPLIGALLFQGSSTALFLMMPETLPLPMPDDSIDGDGSGSISTATSDSGDDQNYKKSHKSWIRQAQSSFRFITRDPAIAALVLTFLISKVGRQSTNVLFQYVSKRYG
jgi:hypothetical protein